MPTRSMSMISMSMIIVWAMCISMVVMSSWPTDLMELDSITGIIFRSIESHMWEIVPDRQCCSIYQIREEELVEHEDDSEWNKGILMTHDITIEPRASHDISIVWDISEKYKNRLDLKNIRLLDHIDHHTRERKQEISRYKHIDQCIECRMCRLTHDESTMYREEYREDEYEVYSDAHEKYWESERKQWSIRTKWRIPHEEYHEEDVYPHTDDRPECRFEYTMQCDEIIEYNNTYKHQSHDQNIELRHLECHRERREERHS